MWTTSRVSSALDAFFVPGGPLARPPLRDPDNELHVDADAVCPRCFAWIAPSDYVRRTSLGLPQHEVCPSPLAAPVPRES
jgi:hypothetical protein